MAQDGTNMVAAMMYKCFGGVGAGARIPKAHEAFGVLGADQCGTVDQE